MVLSRGHCCPRACVPSGVCHSNTAVSSVLAGEWLPKRQHGDGSMGPPACATSRGTAGHHSRAMQTGPGQPTRGRGSGGHRSHHLPAVGPQAPAGDAPQWHLLQQLARQSPCRAQTREFLGSPMRSHCWWAGPGLLRTQPHGPTTNGTRSSGHRSSRPPVCWTHCPHGKRLFPAGTWLTEASRLPWHPCASSRTYQMGREARPPHPPGPGWGRQLDGL